MPKYVVHLHRGGNFYESCGRGLDLKCSSISVLPQHFSLHYVNSNSCDNLAILVQIFLFLKLDKLLLMSPTHRPHILNRPAYSMSTSSMLGSWNMYQPDYQHWFFLNERQVVQSKSNSTSTLSFPMNKILQK